MTMPAMSNYQDSIPKEFVTVDAVLGSGGVTDGVDAFALTWIKTEKQLRRLFCFLVFRCPEVSIENREAFELEIIQNPKLSLLSFIRCVDALNSTSLSAIVGDEYDEFLRQIKRMQRNRDKILHAKITGKKIGSEQLKADVALLRRWIETVARCSSEALATTG